MSTKTTKLLLSRLNSGTDNDVGVAVNPLKRWGIRSPEASAPDPVIVAKRPEMIRRRTVHRPKSPRDEAFSKPYPSLSESTDTYVEAAETLVTVGAGKRSDKDEAKQFEKNSTVHQGVVHNARHADAATNTEDCSMAETLGTVLAIFYCLYYGLSGCLRALLAQVCMLLAGCWRGWRWVGDSSVKRGNANVQKRPSDAGNNDFDFVLRLKWSEGKLTVQSDEMRDDR
ncbi:hypothetical protein BBAD15_g4675 [Beauveria bassiana D1-5]|uniref:Uncharacterized protein n=1 Tax=Beauveria bassiana D1-5 TaxID=1245745 RepID=A0A0A2VUF2_BEABA|nr:hypothetical protein BBAD15_g4675 [Beauveria bassiana D1-5]